MILETVRAVADYLEANLGTTLAALTYDGTDTAPATPAVIDETRDDVAATGRDPDAVTSYVRVTASEVRSLDGDGAQYRHDADVPLELTVVVQATSPAAAVRDLYYLLRALTKCLDAMFATSTTRNGVQLSYLVSLSAATVRAEIVDHTATGMVLCTVRGRDLLA